jgi:hypothetical protein
MVPLPAPVPHQAGMAVGERLGERPGAVGRPVVRDGDLPRVREPGAQVLDEPRDVIGEFSLLVPDREDDLDEGHPGRRG